VKRINCEIINGYQDALPLGIGVSIYGLVYGILAKKIGMSIAEIFFMSLFVFAGCAQFAVLPLIACNDLFAIIITTYILNIQHYLMGASLLPYLDKKMSRLGSAVLAFFKLGNPERYGFDFAFGAAFLGLLIPQLKSKVDIVTAFTAGILSLLSYVVLPGKWYIIIGALGGSTTCPFS
jgi:predicted branched-subunit amino acid permease